MMNGKCLIIYNEPATDALPDELDVIDQVNFIETTLKKIGISTQRRGLTENFFSEVAMIAKEDFDFIFNLAEAVGQRAEILYFIPALLNMHHIPYTGCPVEAAFLSGSKVLARQIMKAHGIPVAGGHKISEAAGMVPGRKYILKPVWEDGSLGITEESVFIFDGSVPGILKGKDDSHWFIEEFIEGREFNVSVISGPDGPVMLPPAEMVFNNYPDDIPRIVSYKAKWEEDTFQYHSSRRSFPDNLSITLLNNLKETVMACWDTFGLRGYARVDMRVDANDEVYVLEINANPCISPDGGFIAAALHAGKTPEEIICDIIHDLNR